MVAICGLVGACSLQGLQPDQLRHVRIVKLATTLIEKTINRPRHIHVSVADDITAFFVAISCLAASSGIMSL